MSKIINIPHNCTHCELRHEGLQDCNKYYLLDDCPQFVIGKCYRCKHKDCGEDIGICLAEDMSGFDCPNFAE